MAADQDDQGRSGRQEGNAGRDVYVAGRDQTFFTSVAGPDALIAFTPLEAARRVARMPHDQAVYRIVDAPAGRSGEILEALLDEDEGKAVALLADIRRETAQDLINAMASPPVWLRDLPAAAEAIAQRQRKNRAVLGSSMKSLAHARPSRQGTEGYYQRFEGGTIHWTAVSGAVITTGEIAEYHRSKKGSGGKLGFPFSPCMNNGSSSFGTSGSWQRFEGMRKYHQDICARIGACGATVYWSEKSGAHATWGSIGGLYERADGAEGWLGFPATDEESAGPSHRDPGEGTTGLCQRFEGGAIYYTGKTGAIAVPAHVLAYLDSHHGVTSARGFPVSPEIKAADSPYGTTGRCQRFEGTCDYPKDILDMWSDQEGPGGATIYTSVSYGTHCVGWGNGVLYERLHGTSGELGFPKTDEVDARQSENEPWCTTQEFEGGTIFFKMEYGSVIVSRTIMEWLHEHERVLRRLGFPVKGEGSLTSGDGDRMQFFEHGVVTIRDGAIEAWLRPEM